MATAPRCSKNADIITAIKENGTKLNFFKYNFISLFYIINNTK